MLTRLFIKIGAFLVFVLAAVGIEYFVKRRKKKPAGNIIEVPFDINEEAKDAEDLNETETYAEATPAEEETPKTE
ncbi:MAG: hypothetical protein MJ150_03245 [Clostridia bacterium]|nr:hypothetical protein [Clostridia bacterium]